MREVIITLTLQGFDIKKIDFLRVPVQYLVLGIALKCYSSMGKGLKAKFKKF